MNTYIIKKQETSGLTAPLLSLLFFFFLTLLLYAGSFVLKVEAADYLYCQTGGAYGDDPDCPPDWDTVDDLQCRPFGDTVTCRWLPKKDDGDEDEDFCKKFPNSPKCQEDDEDFSWVLNANGSGNGAGKITGAAVGLSSQPLNCSISSGSKSGVCTASGRAESRLGSSHAHVTAAANSGSTFDGWRGAASSCGTNRDCYFDILERSPSVTVTATFNKPASPPPPPAPTLSLTLTPDKKRGKTGETFRFTPGVSGTATGTNSFPSATCGSGGTRTGFNSSTGVFTCTYSTTGTKTASERVARGNIGAEGVASVNVEATPPPPPLPPAPEYILTVTVIPPGSGRVTGAGTYPQGRVVTPVATANPGYLFSSWTGDCTGSGTCTVTMNKNKTVGARFTSTLDKLKFTANPVWVPNGGTSTLHWEGVSATSSCRLTGGGINVGPLVGTEGTYKAGPITRVTHYTVECQDGPSRKSAGVDVYILPTYREF